jgi:O-antigen ligase
LPSRAATRSSETPRLSSRSELLAAPPLAAAALGIFFDGGYGADSRVAFALAGIACGAVAIHAAREDALHALRHPLALTLLALAVLGALSAVWTLGPEERTLRWSGVVIGWLGVMAGAAVAARTARGVGALAAGVGAIAAVAAAAGLVAVALEDEPYALRTAGDWRPAGPLEYAPALALLVVCALPIYLHGLRCRAPAARAACVLALVLSAAAIGLAQSRIALALTLAVLAVAAYRVTQSRALVVAGFALALVAGSLAFGGGDGPDSGFLHGRENTWDAGVETFLDRPLYGAGADAFLAGSARHQDGAAIAFAHNLPLELAAELGVLGLLLAISVYVATAWLVWASRRTEPAWLFGPAVVAFPLANLLDWPWHLAGLGAIWALACGALAGASGFATKHRGT